MGPPGRGSLPTPLCASYLDHSEVNSNHRGTHSDYYDVIPVVSQFLPNKMRYELINFDRSNYIYCIVFSPD